MMVGINVDRMTSLQKALSTHMIAHFCTLENTFPYLGLVSVKSDFKASGRKI